MNIIFSGKYNAVEMNCIVGDILQADTMAIGTICDQRFVLNGGLARVIKEAAGNGFMASLRAAENEQISAAKAVITSAQNIRAQYVLLMPISRHITLDVAYNGIFQKAQTLNITSLTIPLFGTGQLDMQFGLCTAYLKTALMQIHNFGSLQKINFIDKHERTMRSLGEFLAAEIHVSPQRIIQPPPTGPMPSNSAAGNQADQPSTSSSSAQQNNHNQQPPPQQDDHSILLWPNTNMAYAGPRRTTARMSTRGWRGMSTGAPMRTSAVNSSFRAIGSGTRDSPIQLMTPARVATNTGGGGDGPQSQQQEQPTSAVVSSSSDDEAMEQEDHSNNSTLSSDSNSTELEDSDEEDSSDDSSAVGVNVLGEVLYATSDSDDDGEEMDEWTKKGDKLLTKEEKSLWSPISVEKLRNKSQKENNRLFDKPTCSKNVTPPGPRLDDTSEPCSICLTDMREEQENDDGGIVQLSLCSHQFHLECIRSAFKVKKQCPLCMCWYGSPIGCQPKDATMKVRLVPGKIPGCRGVKGFHEITYHIPAGIQTSDHIRPGKPYGASTRVAFLPNNKEGTEVLKLLQLAFKRRLTFTIGDSVTSGKQNVVIWNGIHHKTSMTGGPYGYPDAGYLRRVKEELASLGVRVEEL